MKYQHSKILVVFEGNNLFNNEQIRETHFLKRRFCDICVLEDIKNNVELLKKYSILIDCTFDNKLIQNQIKRKAGVLLKKNKIEYIKTASNKIMIKGLNISMLTSNFFNENIEDRTEEYDEIINFSYEFDYSIKNRLNFETGLKSDIIFFSDNKKKYILVDDPNRIPENNLENNTYITPDGIELLEKFIKISEFLK